MLFTEYLQTQPLLRVAIMLILGIIVGDLLSTVLPTWTFFVFVLAVLLCVIVELILTGKPYTQSFVVLLAVFFLGVGIIIKKDKEMTYNFDSQSYVEYEAIVIGAPQVRGKTLKCDLCLTSINGKTLDNQINIKASILRDTLTNDWKNIKLGNGIKVCSVIEPLCNFRGGNFDYVRWLHCHNFIAQTFIYSSDWDFSKADYDHLGRFERLRLAALILRDKVVSKIEIKDQQTAVIAAMTLGDKHLISKETKEDYSISGASHILALSGLHLGIIYAVLTFFFGFRKRSNWISQVLILIVIWAYVFIVGMGSSVVRSAIMLTIYSLCLVAGQNKTSINTLSLAAICMLISNPLCLWDMGFQMSFMAVLSIVIFYKHIYFILPQKIRYNTKSIFAKLLIWLWGMTSVSIAAQIGTVPLVAYYFGRFSCYFLITNYIVIPCATMIIYCSLAVVVMSFIPFISNILFHFLLLLTTFLNSSVTFISSLPGSSIEGIEINILQVWCMYIALGLACIIHSYLRRLAPLAKL